MGMFDTVRYICPHCGKFASEQSKAGPCILETYYIDDAPAEIKCDLVNSEVYCDHCNERVYFNLAIQPVLYITKEKLL